MIWNKRLQVILLGLVIILLGSISRSFGQDNSHVIDDFEDGDFDDHWWSYNDGSVFSCEFGQPGYNSNRALQMSFNVNTDSYPGCGIDIEPGQWRGTAGLSFAWHSDQPGITVLVSVGIGDPTDEDIPSFGAVMETPGDAWTRIELAWTAANWMSEDGVAVLDPEDVVELVFEVVESQSGTIWIDDLQLMSAEEAPGSLDKFALWTGETQLRGANIWQRIVIPELDSDFLGSGHVGPPYTQEDFNRLAALGANLVNISGPGLFTENPPYVLDEAAQTHLDSLLQMIARADMFAVISFRTGPGRSDFTFYRDGAGVWFDESLLIEWVWTDQAAQDAWVEMWRYTAARYRDNPIVVGYDLMVEPNGNILATSGDIYEPDDFYSTYAGTLLDWNQFYPNIVSAIREVDAETPILVGGMGWSGVAWLPYLEPTDDPRTVYMVHQYQPQDEYTHQEPTAAVVYPGTLDLDYDGNPDAFDRPWLDSFLSIIDEFQAQNGVPIAVNEFGVHRWVPGGAMFMDDSMAFFEQRGMNHALWLFHPDWSLQAEEDDEFDFLHGPDPNNHTNVESSDLIEVIKNYWARNTVRP